MEIQTVYLIFGLSVTITWRTVLSMVLRYGFTSWRWSRKHLAEWTQVVCQIEPYCHKYPRSVTGLVTDFELG